MKHRSHWSPGKLLQLSDGWGGRVASPRESYNPGLALNAIKLHDFSLCLFTVSPCFVLPRPFMEGSMAEVGHYRPSGVESWIALQKKGERYLQKKGP